MTSGIYLHIPFCRIKCPYCDFNTYTGMQARIPSYVQALLKELTLRVDGEAPDRSEPVRSIYFGGGTPSLLSPEQVAALLDGIRGSLPLASEPEITLEANPGTVTTETLAGYREAGVNRLTIGCQTFQPELLRGLGRLHSTEDSLRTIEQAQSVGFDNLNIDLMFGLPSQTLSDWEADLDTVAHLPLSHLSLYNLTIEEATPFAREQEAGRLLLPEEEACREMYLLAVDRAQTAGFVRYEVSNFAQSGRTCLHNQLYWSGKSWIALGAGAHGFSAGVSKWGRRWWNLRAPGAYMASIKAGDLPEAGSELLQRQQAIDEALMLGLRTREGLDLERFHQRFGIDPLEHPDHHLADALSKGLLEVKSGRLVATENAVIIVDYLIQHLASSLDRPAPSDSLGPRHPGRATDATKGSSWRPG
ncbi:MAG: radical SAM family heme chaperone HemW [Myxococcota bacterium]|nr:radical SAM family heme chaperone HemW [Myxococcota bacterium]